MEQWLAQYGIWGALIISLGANLIVLLRSLAPKVYGDYATERKARLEHQISQMEAQVNANLQQDATTAQNMILLQTRVVETNKSLIEFITGSLTDDIKTMTSMIREDLERIDQEFLALAKQVGGLKDQQRLLTMEVAGMIDKYKTFESRFMERYRALKDKVDNGDG